MADYIRRDDALKLLSDDIPICGASLYQAGAKGGLQIAHGIVAAIPAADVAPVVRCKDCKHFKDYGKTSLLVDEENIKAGWCYRRVRYDEEYRMPPDGFCSYGKIRNGG